MSATRPSRQDGATRAGSGAPRDISHLQARRREAERRRQLLRLDVAVGVFVAIVLLVATPGVAMAAILALLLLLLCFGSVMVERRRNRPPKQPRRRPRASEASVAEAPRRSARR